MTTTPGAAAVAEPAADDDAALGAPSAAPATCTFYVAVGGNDWYWRATAPANALGGKVCVIDEKPQPIRGEGGKFAGRSRGMTSAIMRPNNNSGLHWELWRDTDDPDYYETRYPDHEGAAIWTRPDPPRAVHAQQMREQGILSISEVDDNYLAPAKFNIHQRMSKFGVGDQLTHLRAMASFDRMVFSTEWLRDHYRKAIRKILHFPKSQMPEMFVCRNCIDEAEWPETIPREGPLRVGWMGSQSHIWDVDVAWNALLHAKRLGCETVMIGYDPSHPEGHSDFPDELRSARSSHKVRQWERVGFRHIPWVKPEQYHRAALPLDIGLCPLLDNTATQGKSPVKWVEFSISGAAVIAQNTVVYQKAIKHGETGLLVGSPREMLAAVDLLVRDTKLRETLVANARQDIRENWGLKQLREEWGAAIG